MRRELASLAVVGSLVGGCASAREAPSDLRVLGTLSADEAAAVCEESATQVAAAVGDRDAHIAKFCTWVALYDVLEGRAESCAARRDECIADSHDPSEMQVESMNGCGGWVWPATCGATVGEFQRCLGEEIEAYLMVLDPLSCDDVPASPAALDIPTPAPDCAWLGQPACIQVPVDDTDGAAGADE